MVRDARLDKILGTKKFFEHGLSMDQLILSRPSSYGDYFFVSPVIKQIKRKYPNIKIIYIANGDLDNEYLTEDQDIFKVVPVFRIDEDNWQDQKFKFDNGSFYYLLDLLRLPSAEVLSYQGIDGDFTFGDFSCNLFTFHMRGAGFDCSPNWEDRKYTGGPKFKSLSESIFSTLGLVPNQYAVFHPFSSQAGRGWTQLQIVNFLRSYNLSVPLILLGRLYEGSFLPFSEFVLDFRGKTTFLESMVLTKYSKFGLFAESCMMHVGQVFRVPSIITHVHSWTRNVTTPYHEQTVPIIMNGSYEGLDIKDVLEKVKQLDA